MQRTEDTGDTWSDREKGLPDLNPLLLGLKEHVAIFMLNLQEKHLLKVPQETT